MTDYGAPIRFGLFPEPRADRRDQVREQVVLADRLGLDLVGIQDHPYQARYLDTLTLVADLAARTERIGFCTDVANLPLRPPAVLARVATTLDLLSGGRFDLGLGAGAFWDAVVAMGGPRRTPGEAVSAVAEAIDVLRLLWSAERGLRYDGTTYRLAGAYGGPVPTRPIGIWVGALGPRMLELIGRAADGWVPSSAYAPPERLDEGNERIDAAAAAAGRSPRAVRRIYNVGGRIGEPDEGFLRGPAPRWVDELTALALDHGVDTFVLWAEGDPAEQLHRLAEEVAPEVRAAVAAARS